MRQKICYLFLTVIFAVTMGHTSDIGAYAYEPDAAEGMQVHEIERVCASCVVSADAQSISADVVREAQAEAEEILLQQQPGKWDYLFEEELKAIEAGLQKGMDIWTAFPDINSDPQSSIAVLCQIVEAEAGGEDLIGKTMVADVVLNRIEAGFGDSVQEVVFAEGQFDPVASGYYYMVNPSESTRHAVYLAISGNDYTSGARYFCTPTSGVEYFSSFLTWTATHGGHVFFK